MGEEVTYIFTDQATDAMSNEDYGTLRLFVVR